jgi:hypothetical protein
VIPGALVVPARAGRLGPQPRTTVVQVIGVVFLVLVVAGALAWSNLSPFGMRRWRLLDPSQTITVKEPGTFVIYEESPGAAGGTGPALVSTSVRSIGGRRIETKDLLDANGASPSVYRTPWHEGRAVTSFVIDKPGTYAVLSFPTAAATEDHTRTNAAGPGGVLDLTALPRVALAPEGTPGVLGGLGGLALLTIVPLVGGVAVLTFAYRRWPSPLRRRFRRSAATVASEPNLVGDPIVANPSRGARAAGGWERVR